MKGQREKTRGGRVRAPADGHTGGSESGQAVERRRFTDVFGSVREARSTIFGLGLGADLEERAALVVTELATNAVLHGGGILFVRIWYGDGRLRVEVTDSSEALPEACSPGNMSGRGLQIVSALARAWGAEPRPGGKVVWAELD